jgi:hypothetical protein
VGVKLISFLPYVPTKIHSNTNPTHFLLSRDSATEPVPLPITIASLKSPYYFSFLPILSPFHNSLQSRKPLLFLSRSDMFLFKFCEIFLSLRFCLVAEEITTKFGNGCRFLCFFLFSFLGVTTLDVVLVRKFLFLIFII